MRYQYLGNHLPILPAHVKVLYGVQGVSARDVEPEGQHTEAWIRPPISG